MKAAVVSDGKFSDSFGFINETKQDFIMSPVLFAIFLVMLKFAFGDMDSDIKFQFRTSGSLFIH